MTSVIIPVYNGAHILATTVPAILALEGVDEWVWVDDGSTDDTASFLARSVADKPRAHVVTLPANQGRAAARNAGIGSSSGEIVVFFDADVEPPSRSVLELVRAVEATDGISAVARLSPVLDQPDDPYQDYLAHFPRGPDVTLAAGSKIDWRFFLSGLSAVRRSALREIGGFPETVSYGEDLALGCRLARRYPDGLRLADTVVRLHDVGTLTDAVGHAQSFGRNLSAVRAECPQLRAARLGRVFGTRHVATVGARCLQHAVERLRPGRMRRRSVRYLLGAHVLSASGG